MRMDYLLTGGVVLTLAGVAMLFWCVWLAVRAKRSGLPDAQMKAALQRVVALNLGALALSALGLMAVVVALILG
jgi:hypothetical protein